MKKRLISMLMAVLMIASLLPAAALAEAPATDTHEHKYTTVSIKKDAEKKTPGVEYKVCKECGKIDTKSISIKAFALLWNQCRKCEIGKTMIVKAASCRNEGLTISYCEKCGKAFANKDFGNSTYKIEKHLSTSMVSSTSKRLPPALSPAPAMLYASFAAMQLTSRVRRRQLNC